MAVSTGLFAFVKMFDTSCPVGAFVAKDNVPKPHNLGNLNYSASPSSLSLSFSRSLSLSFSLSLLIQAPSSQCKSLNQIIKYIWSKCTFNSDIWLEVNGVMRQQSNTENFIFRYGPIFLHNIYTSREIYRRKFIYIDKVLNK